MVKNRKFILSKKIDGMPSASNFTLVEEDTPALKSQEILTEAIFLSVDPYMRVLASRLPLNSMMIASQVARVIESKHSDFQVGQILLGNFGWQTHFCGNPDETEVPFYGKFRPEIIPDMKGQPLSYAIGALGMPGVTAYFGFLKICDPKPGEVVVVNGAAGAVGSLVGQIAKIKGCTVIAYAGSDEKVKWLKEELKFDHVFNYKKVSIDETLAQAAPEGVDCFFDNVGGKMSMSVLAKMNTYGRVSVCGAISTYNKEGSQDNAIIDLNTILFKQIKIEGFIVTRWLKEYPVAIKQMATWIVEDKIKVKELVFEGFDNMVNAFTALFTGDNMGKIVIKI